MEMETEGNSTGDTRGQERPNTNTRVDQAGREVAGIEEREMRGERTDNGQRETILHEFDPAKYTNKAVTDEEKYCLLKNK